MSFKKPLKFWFYSLCLNKRIPSTRLKPEPKSNPNTHHMSSLHESLNERVMWEITVARFHYFECLLCVSCPIQKLQLVDRGKIMGGLISHHIHRVHMDLLQKQVIERSLKTWYKQCASSYILPCSLTQSLIFKRTTWPKPYASSKQITFVKSLSQV